MAKAHFVLPDGTKIDIEGSADEISLLLGRFSKAPVRQDDVVRKEKPVIQRAKTATRKAPRQGPISLIADLVDENFFKAKRSISDVRRKLEEAGHIYPIVQLSTPLLRLTRRRVLRRIKEKSGWVYVS